MKKTLVLALYIPLRFEAQHYSEFKDILLFMRSQEFWTQKVHVLEKNIKASISGDKEPRTNRGRKANCYLFLI